ncbi:MAG: 16S rRNA (uracil(1498)-N(3))-methyltransferase [Halobacteriovoraceae bacterium]|nr:16S rRNA (uracil(1498)-N(3))-methyltransferase [Halobacteriovoraceae bacterium]
MRAIYLENIEPDIGKDGVIFVDGENAKHLIQSVRIRSGEKILVLNGRGLKVHCEVQEISKRDLNLRVFDIQEIPDNRTLSLILAPPKKEAFEEIIKKSMEIGIKEIIIFDSEFSIRSQFNLPRLEKIVESALIQSNGTHKLELKFEKTFEDVIKTVPIESIFYFCTRQTSDKLEIRQCKKYLLIGPEGGFSIEEEEKFNSLKIQSILLPTNILRSPTAVCVASGYMLALERIN